MSARCVKNIVGDRNISQGWSILYTFAPKLLTTKFLYKINLNAF
jgi:hypothetical protein